MDWLKKHADTLVILGVILTHFYWIDGKFEKFNDRMVTVEKDIGIIKAVLLMKNILPTELAHKEEIK